MSMQERLAAAMARSASPGLRAASPVRSASAVASARSSMDRSRGSFDKSSIGRDKESREAEGEGEGKGMKQEQVEKPTKADDEGKVISKDAVTLEITARGAADDENTPPLSSSTPISSPPESQLTAESISDQAIVQDTSPPIAPTIAVTNIASSISPSPRDTVTNTNSNDYEGIIAQLREDLAACEIRRQEEAHTASESIDALENKIKYLARESADVAKRRGTSSPAGGLEKKLAEKDERISLLIEEGERLSKLELKSLTIIKRLRAKMVEDEKAAAETNRKLEKVEREAAESKEKLKKAVENEKKSNERIKAASKLESEVESLRRDKSDKETLILDLKAQLVSAQSRADDAESKVRTEALELERKTTGELKDQVEKIQAEATLMEERLKIEIGDLMAKIERDTERAKMTEAELRSEVAVMETKMEVLRARAEEVSSGAAGDAHSKLLRQVETLQTQYAIASENWQGIEGSLLARVSAVERERDGLAKTEADVRRKARDLVSV